MAFGKRLIEQPLMRNVLADLALESEAATALALRLARAFDRRGDAHEAAMARLLTPIAKFWICKRGSHFAQEAMECLGGNGYVEEGGEGVMARIYREMPLNSIWEGAGNIMALDLLRALRKADAAAALAQELAPAKGAHPRSTAWPPPADAGGGDGQRSRSAPAGAGRGAGRAGRAAVPDRARRRVRRLLRLAPGRRLGPGLRHAVRRDRLRHHPATRHAALNHRMNDLILHHYASSPFSEKIRLILGYKKLPWKSVLMPPIMPKPDVVALTGGYRKTPVLQVGADIYCDTALICDVLEHVRPEPTLYPPHLKGVCRIFAQWADSSCSGPPWATTCSPRAPRTCSPRRRRKRQGLRRGPQGDELQPGAAAPRRRHLGLPLLPAPHRQHGRRARLPVRHGALRRRLRGVPRHLVHAQPGAAAGRHPERHALGGRVGRSAWKRSGMAR
jgi:glutathione S-transferase